MVPHDSSKDTSIKRSITSTNKDIDVLNDSNTSKLKFFDNNQEYSYKGSNKTNLRTESETTLKNVRERFELDNRILIQERENV